MDGSIRRRVESFHRKEGLGEVARFHHHLLLHEVVLGFKTVPSGKAFEFIPTLIDTFRDEHGKSRAARPFFLEAASLTLTNGEVRALTRKQLTIPICSQKLERLRICSQKLERLRQRINDSAQLALEDAILRLWGDVVTPEGQPINGNRFKKLFVEGIVKLYFVSALGGARKRIRPRRNQVKDVLRPVQKLAEASLSYFSELSSTYTPSPI